MSDIRRKLDPRGIKCTAVLRARAPMCLYRFHKVRLGSKNM